MITITLEYPNVESAIVALAKLGAIETPKKVGPTPVILATPEAARTQGGPRAARAAGHPRLHRVGHTG